MQALVIKAYPENHFEPALESPIVYKWSVCGDVDIIKTNQTSDNPKHVENNMGEV